MDNLTTTAASVVAAIFIGSIETIGLIAYKLDLKGGAWAGIRDLDDDLALRCSVALVGNATVGNIT